MSEESITALTTTDNSFDPEIIYNFGKAEVQFKEICLKQNIVFYSWKYSKFIYFLQSKYIVKRSNHRF